MRDVQLKRNIFEKWNLLVLFLIVITQFIFVESLSNRHFSFPNANVSSICPNNDITKWNTKNVSQILKEWIKSVSIQWNADERVPCERHCKIFAMKPNYFVDEYAPNKTFPDIMMIGKVEDIYKSKMKNKKYGTNTEINKPAKLHGPIWMDIHSGYNWDINHNQQHGKLSGQIKSRALFLSGLYYGALNNEQLKLGR